MWMSSISQSPNQRSPDYVGQRAGWCHTFWQHDKKPKRETERGREIISPSFGVLSWRSAGPNTHTHTHYGPLYTSPNLAANNKALSETFITFINKSQWLMLALFFGISNKVWHIYTLGQRSQSPIKHVWEDRWLRRTHIHTRSLAEEKEINQTMPCSCFSVQVITSKVPSCPICSDI